MAALVGTIGAAVQSTSGASVSTLAFGASETRAAGNLLICFATVTGTATLPTTPAGWYIAKQVAGTSTSATIYYRNAAGSDAAPTIAGIPSGLIAAQLAEYSGALALIDQSGSSTGTSSPNTATAGGANAATGELIVMAAADFRSVARASNDTWTSNDGTPTLGGSNNGVSSTNHYSHAYIASSTATTAQTSVVTLSITTSITGIANVNASFKTGIGTFLGYGQAQAQIKAIGVNGFGQAQAKVNAFNVEGVGQAQADIKVTSNGFGQAQAKIPVISTKVFAQAQTQITLTIFSDTFTRTVSNGLGVADNTDTWLLKTGTASNFSVNGTQAKLITDSTTSQLFRLDNTSSISKGVEYSGTFAINKLPVGAASPHIDFGTGPASGLATAIATITIHSSADVNVTGAVAGNGFASTSSGYVAGDLWNFKVQILPTSNSDTFVASKTWKVGTTEPADWQGDPSLVGSTLSANNVIINVGGISDANAPFTWTLDNLQIIPAFIVQGGQAQARIIAVNRQFGQAQALIIRLGYAQAQALIDSTRVYAQAQARIFYQIGILNTPTGFGNNDFDGVSTPRSSAFTNDYIDFLGGMQFILPNESITSNISVGISNRNFFYMMSGPLQDFTFPAGHIAIKLRPWVSTTISTAPLIGTSIGMRMWKISADSIWTDISLTGVSADDINAFLAPDPFHISAPTVLVEGDIGVTNFSVGDRIAIGFNLIAGSQKTVPAWQPNITEYLSGSAQVSMYASGESVWFDQILTVPEMARTFQRAQAAAQILAFNVNKVAQAQATITTPYGFANTQAFISPGYRNAVAWAQGTVELFHGKFANAQATITLLPSDFRLKFGQARAYMTLGPGTPRYANAQASITQMLGRQVFAQAMAYIPGDWYILYDEFDRDENNNTTWLSAARSVSLFLPQDREIQLATNTSLVSVRSDSSSLILSGGIAGVVTRFTKQTESVATSLVPPISYTLYAKFKFGDSVTGRFGINGGTNYSSSAVTSWRNGTTAIKDEPLKIVSNEWAWIRIDYDLPNNIGYAKIWRATDPEPSAWNFVDSVLANNQTLALIASGVNQTVWIDEIRVAPLGQTRAFRWRGGQAQALIVPGAVITTTQQFAQSQADILVTINRFAQAQSDILAATNHFAQAQADILAVGQSYAQAQADIKAVTIVCAQAQACIVGNGFGQAQADIKQTSQGYANAQADIQTTYFGFAQAQGEIKVTSNAFAQAQSDIKQIGYGFSQVQGDIKATSNVFAQANADINATSRGYGQSQSDIKQTYQVYANAQADIKQTSNGFGQSNADIKATSSGFGQANADILVTEFGFAQAQADIKQTYNGYGQSQADIKQTYQGYANSQSDIKATSVGCANAQGTILATSNGCGQANADIKQTYQGYGQAQADIVTSYQGYAQAQADIKQTYQGYANARADILVTTDQFAQAQGTILATTNHFAQANADIKAQGYGFGQANAQIIAFGVNQSGNAQGNIAGKNYPTGQAQAQIKAFGVNGYGQAQGDILASTVRCGQAQANIKATSDGFGQAQSDIKVTTNKFAQSNADIKATTSGYAQSAADIRVTNYGWAQGNANIKSTTNVEAQANADIKTTTNQSGNAQSDIKVTSNVFGQAQGYVRNAQYGFAQAQAYILSTHDGYANAQADILVVTNKSGNAQGVIRTGNQAYANAQGSIKVRARGYAQAQTQIVTTVNKYGQSQALIVVENIAQQGNAQALIVITVITSGQAQAQVATFYFAQAQAKIKVSHIMKRSTIDDRAEESSLSDRADISALHDGQIRIRNSDSSLTSSLSDKNLRLISSDRSF